MRKTLRVAVCGMVIALSAAAALGGLRAATSGGSGGPAPSSASTAAPSSTAAQPDLLRELNIVLYTTNSPGSLAAAMAQAKPPAGQIAIAIGANHVRLPDGNMPPPGSSVSQLADRYGMLAHPFGGVIAIAPSTMIVLNNAPGVPDGYTGMPPADAFKLLVGSLTSAQWQTLTSAQGLGIGDLQSQDQRDLFRASFPESGLHVTPAVAPGDSPSASRLKIISPDDAAQGHLRLSSYAELVLPTTQHNTGAGFDHNRLPGSGPSYTAYDASGITAGPGALYGANIQTVAPNVPKPGDLDFQAASLQTPIDLTGIKTVRDLIKRIARETGIEIYADLRYEMEPVSISADARAARAADLLRAMVFCLSATYRRVGPAYVLTHDLVGAGTHRAIIEQFKEAADRMRRGLINKASDAILEAHALSDLPGQPGTMTMTPDQIQGWLKQQTARGAGMDLMITVPVEKLSSQQLAIARQTMSAYNQRLEAFSKLPDRRAESLSPPATLDGPVRLWTKPTVELLLPSLDGPAEMDEVLKPDRLFVPSPQLRSALDAAAPKPGPRIQTGPRSLSGAVKLFPRRGVLVQAHTASEVDSIVASMRRLGLNELWLEVFDPDVPDVSTKTELDGGDLLAEALKVTHGTGIRILPVVRLLKWRATTPAAERDLTITGSESPAAIALRRLDKLGDPKLPGWTPHGMVSAAPQGIAVSPFAPSVQDRLTKLMANLAREPGIAGLVWRSPAIAGYSAFDSRFPEELCTELGYSEPARIAFLRASHVDPVDIDPIGTSETPPALPGFEDIWNVPNDASTYSTVLPPHVGYAMIDRSIRAQWEQFRVNENMSLLRHLAAAAGALVNQNVAAPDGTRPLPLLIEADRTEYDEILRYDWYGSWDGNSSLPALKFFPGADEFPRAAHKESKMAILSIIPGETWTGANVATFLEDRIRHAPWDGAAAVWDGLVLDLTAPHSGPGRAPTCAEWLAGLAK